MDTTALQNTVDTLKSSVTTDETQLSTDNAALTQAEKDLSVVALVNQLEQLTPDEVATVQGMLANDTDNTSGISISLPASAPSEAAPVADAPPADAEGTSQA